QRIGSRYHFQWGYALWRQPRRGTRWQSAPDGRGRAYRDGAGASRRADRPRSGECAMTPRMLNVVSSALLIALVVLCVLWETWLAPIRPGGSWMVLKVLPLLAAVFGVLKGRRYTYQWLSMLVLLYFTEGVVRAFDPGLGGVLAVAEAVLSAALFIVVLLYARQTAPSRLRPPEPG